MLLEFGGANQVDALKIIFNYSKYNYTFFNDLNGDPRFILVQIL